MPSKHMDLYPTMDSVWEAVAYIESQCPIQSPNQMFPLLMMYHNTLLKCWKEGDFVMPSSKETVKPELSKYLTWEPYKVISLVDIDDIDAGTQLNVTRGYNNIMYLMEGNRVVFVGAEEGTHFKLIENIPEQQVLKL